MGEEDAKALLSAAEGSKTIEELTITDTLSCSCTEEIDQLIRQTQSLTEIDLHVDLHFDLESLAVALRQNSSLQRIFIYRENKNFSLLEAAAFHESLEDHNFSLKHLKLRPFGNRRHPLPAPARSEEHQAHLEGIDFLLSLNRWGRSEVLAPGNTIEDMMAFIADEDDASVIFHF